MLVVVVLLVDSAERASFVGLLVLSAGLVVALAGLLVDSAGRATLVVLLVLPAGLAFDDDGLPPPLLGDTVPLLRFTAP